MKKLYFLLVTLLLGVTSVSAQGLAHSWWSVRGGVNFSNLSSENYSTQYLTGYCVGVAYGHPISNVFPIYLESGLYYQLRGARDNGFLIDNGYESRLRRDEIEVPLLVGYHTHLDRKWSIQSAVGFYYAVALGGEFQLADGTFDPYDLALLQTLRDSRPMAQQLLNRSDFGVRVGVSALYERYMVGFVYDGGLTNIYSRSLRNVGYVARTGCLTILAGYNF